MKGEAQLSQSVGTYEYQTFHRLSIINIKRKLNENQGDNNNDENMKKISLSEVNLA